MEPLNKYEVYVKFTVLGDSEEDAVEYLSDAIDSSDIILQDGMIGVEILEDTVSTLDDEDDVEYTVESDEDDSDE
jgi:hypothetical protein